MPVISLTEYDTKCYGVKIENKDLVKVQKYKNVFDNENNILCVKPLEKFWGKCDVCNMLSKEGVLDKAVINGNTILLKIGEENFKNRYVNVGAIKVYSFITNDQIMKYISNMGDNLIPYSKSVVEENVYFLSPHCKYTKIVKIRDVDLFKTNGNSVDPFDYHLQKHGPDRFENLLEFTSIHQC